MEDISRSVDEGAQLGCGCCASREVDKETRLFDAGLRHQPTQLFFANFCSHQRLENIGYTHASNCQVDGIERIGDQHRAANAHRHIGLVLAFQVPGVNATGGGNPEADAVVVRKIGYRTWFSLGLKIGWGGHHDRLEGWRQPDCYHVLGDHLAEPDASVEPFADNVYEAVVDGNLDRQIRIAPRHLRDDGRHPDPQPQTRNIEAKQTG